MTTPDDEEALRRLRSLKAELAHSSGLQDRFDDPRLGAGDEALKAEIASIPAHIRKLDQIETTLQRLTYAVEDYIIARVAQFLPDVPDLWEAVKTLPEKSAQRETPAEKPIVRLLDELHALGVEESAVKNAVQRGAALDSYKNPRTLRPLEAVNTRKNYPRLLREHLIGFQKQQRQPSAAALAAQVWAWQQETENASGENSSRARYYRQSILSDVAVLQRIGSSREAITGLIVDAYTPST
jgi:hypothetical protein